ncbi:MAG: SDR family oxidoreductase [Anaerolineae bacterium]|nr:SDR family oxidoreductase [Anaerolineae bacterium]
MNPAGKTAFVTGGAARVGRAISLALAEAGAHVVVHYHRSASAAQETVAAARQSGVEALAVQADLADPDAVRRLIQAICEQRGTVDILVHSASPFIRGSLADTSLATWRQVMGVLVESFFLLTQGLAPGMIARGEGAIVAMLDRGTFDPWPNFFAHGVGKSAIWAMVRSLAVKLAPQVRVNGIVPGPVLPPPGYTEKQRAEIAAGTLLGRWGDPGDVAAAVQFLVRADYVTGEALFVDGGERWAHRRPRTR